MSSLSQICLQRLSADATSKQRVKVKVKGIIHTFFQMRLYLSLQYGRNKSSLNVCECPSISL